MDVGILLVFVVVFLLSYYFMVRQKNLPPGPLSLPIFGCIQITRKIKQKRPHLVLNELSQKYGPVFSFKLGKGRFVILNGFDAINEVLVKRSDEFSDRPDGPLIRHVTRNGAGVILNNYNHNWKILRRFTLQALRDFGVGKSSLEEKIATEIEATTKRFRELGDDPVDINESMQMVIGNILHGIVFGARYDYSDPEFGKVRLLSNAAVSGDGVFNLSNLLPGPIIKLIRLLVKQQTIEERKAVFTKISDFVDESIEEHEATFDDNIIRDLIDLQIKTSRDNENFDNTEFTRGNLKRVINDLFLAGSETTSSSLDWAFLHMAEYPDVQKKCQDEITETVGDKFILYADREKLPYVNATLNEIQRHSMIAPLGVAHSTRVDNEIQGFHIPANSTIIANLYSACMDPKFWTEPDKFKPERFLDTKSKLIKVPAFIPFSTGPRQCLGEPLAKMELFMVFTNMLQRFKFHRENPRVPHTMQSRLTQATNVPKPYRLRVESRS